MLNQNDTFDAVHGSLDSGATSTVAGLQAHGHLCAKLEPMTSQKYAKLPNGSQILISKVGWMNVRVDYKDERSMLTLTISFSFF